MERVETELSVEDIFFMAERVVGDEFNPSGEQLLIYYLRDKNKSPGLVRRDLYGENREPWHVLKHQDPAWQKVKKGKTVRKVIYVVTALNKVKVTHKYISRQAGCGTWHDDSGSRSESNEVRNGEGKLIGHTRKLTFRVPEEDPIFQGDDNNCSYGHWIMHEYTLAKEIKPENNEQAICRITYEDKKTKQSPTKNKKRNRGASTATFGNNDDNDRMPNRRSPVMSLQPRNTTSSSFPWGICTPSERSWLLGFVPPQ